MQCRCRHNLNKLGSLLGTTYIYAIFNRKSLKRKFSKYGLSFFGKNSLFSYWGQKNVVNEVSKKVYSSFRKILRQLSPGIKDFFNPIVAVNYIFLF